MASSVPSDAPQLRLRVFFCHRHNDQPQLNAAAVGRAGYPGNKQHHEQMYLLKDVSPYVPVDVSSSSPQISAREEPSSYLRPSRYEDSTHRSSTSHVTAVSSAARQSVSTVQESASVEPVEVRGQRGSHLMCTGIYYYLCINAHHADFQRRCRSVATESQEVELVERKKITFK